MVKRYFISLLLLCLLSFCGCSKTESMSVRQTGDGWEISDVKITNLPQDANTYVEAITDEGIYYCRDQADPKSSYIDAGWHFLTYSGEDIPIYQEASISYYTSVLNDPDLILALNDEEGIKVVVISPDGTVRELFRQNASQLPFIAASGGLIASIRNNFSKDGISYDNTLILSDLSAGTETTVYRASQHTGTMTGEDIMSVCLTDQEIVFTVKETLSGKAQNWLYTYDISNAGITDKILVEQDVLCAVRAGNAALLSLNKEPGSIGEIADGKYQEKVKIPLMTSANPIYTSAYTPDGIYISCYLSGYFWDTNTNEIYVYDFMPINTEGRSITRQGIRYIIREGSDAFVRTLYVNSSVNSSAE